MTNRTKATPVTTQPSHRPGFWWPAQQQKRVPRRLAREAAVVFGPSLLLDLFVAQSLIWIAAGRGSLQWHGRRYEAGAPEVLDAAAALPLLPDRMQRALGPFHIGQFLRLRCLTTAADALAILSGTSQWAR